MAKALKARPRAGADPAVQEAVRAAESAPAAAASPAGRPQLDKLSLSVAGDIGTRLRYAALDHKVSESGLVEVALRELLDRDKQDVGVILKRHGASRRRRITS